MGVIEHVDIALDVAPEGPLRSRFATAIKQPVHPAELHRCSLSGHPLACDSTGDWGGHMVETDLDTQELRIAPVMTGGTSLAVWMGGATAELYRMVRSPSAPEPGDGAVEIYSALLDLTATKPVVDIITGTSAGGLNGTLLAAAWVLGVDADDFMKIRDTWLNVANLEKLLRSSHEPNPPSLLRGDGYFVPKIRELLEDWRTRAAPLGANLPVVDVVTTVTTVSPEPASRSDDFGEAMSEVNYAQRLQFQTEHFRDPDWVDKLAIAARTSASIPGVFEPSFLPIGGADATATGRPDFAPNASFTSSRWAVDGGTVVNLPLTEALERIFHLPSMGLVRRVALYVCPTPSPERKSRPDQADDKPNIRRALSTVVTAPRAEGVSSDIDELHRENAEVRHQRGTREALEYLLTSIPVPEFATLFASYKQRRARQSVGQMLENLTRRVGRRLPLDEAQLEARLVAARVALLPTTIDEFEGGGRSWGWGIAPVEEAVSIAIGLLSRAQQVTDTTTTESDRILLKESKAFVHGVRANVLGIRQLDTAFWKQRLAAFPDLVRGEGDEVVAGLDEWAKSAYAAWPGEDGEAIFATLQSAHLLTANVIAQSAPAITRITVAAGARQTSPGDDDGPSASRRVQAQAVFDELGTLLAQGDNAESVQSQLLRVHVLQSLLLGDVKSHEQLVELMQVSWNSWNGLDDRSPDDKLAGPELARLGAFLKPSWRANDWCWGRMDAAYRLILLLLEPRRLRQLGHTSAYVQSQFETLIGTPLPSAAVKELAFLDAGDVAIPRTLPATARALACAAQLAIAQEELPIVADAVRASAEQSGHQVESAAFVRAVQEAPRADGQLDPEAVPGLVAAMRIGSETVRGEFGFGLMNRVMTRGASVVVNALTGTASGLSVVARILRPLRAPLQGITSLVSVMAGGSKLTRAVTAFVLALAGAIVAMQIVGAEVPAGTFVVAAVLLTMTFVLAMLRSGFILLSVLFLLGTAVIGLALSGSDLRTIVYSAPQRPIVDRLEPTTLIDFPPDSVLRIRTGEDVGERIQDIEFERRGVVEVRLGTGEVRGPLNEEHVAGWKRWGFINAVSIFRVLAALIGFLAFFGALRARRSGWLAVLPRGGLTAAAAVLAWRAPGLFEPFLTGRAPASDATGRPWKLRIVEFAEALHDYQLEVVLLALVAIGLLLALGTDLAATRIGARLGATWRKITDRS